ARKEDVDVAETRARCRAKIRVANVAAANNCHAAVNDPAFVMHPPCGGEIAYDELNAATGWTCPAAAWIEKAHFNVGMHIERQVGGVEAHGIDVIEHQPHPHAPVGGCQDFPGQQFAGHVTLPIVVLE